MVGSENILLCNRGRNGRSRSSKVVNFGTNQKRVCNFLLVINSNLSAILLRFRDIAGFLRKTTTFTYPTPSPPAILGCFSWSLPILGLRIAKTLGLLGLSISYLRSNPIYMNLNHQRYGRGKMVMFVSAYRYIATANLPIIPVFVQYLRQFLIDFNQIYRHSSVPKTHLRAFMSFLAQAV